MILRTCQNCAAALDPGERCDCSLDTFERRLIEACRTDARKREAVAQTLNEKGGPNNEPA